VTNSTEKGLSFGASENGRPLLQITFIILKRQNTRLATAEFQETPGNKQGRHAKQIITSDNGGI